MRLTNIQLEILTKEIYNKIVERKITAEIKEAIEEKVSNIDYIKDINNILNKYFDIQDEINKLQEERSIISSQLTELGRENGVNIYISSHISKKLNIDLKQLEIDKEINKLVPSKEEIKSKIILNNISGSKDLINDLLKEYE